MKTIKCYVCDCGEEIYQDDEQCCNCYKKVDQSLFKEEEIGEITYQGTITIETIPLTKNSN